MNRQEWNKILRVRTHHTTVYETPLSTDGMNFSDIGTGPDSPISPYQNKQVGWKESELEPNSYQESVSIPEQKLITWPENLKRKRENVGFKGVSWDENAKKWKAQIPY